MACYADLAGIKDIAQAIKLIGETPILEFKEQGSEPRRAMTADENEADELLQCQGHCIGKMSLKKH